MTKTIDIRKAIACRISQLGMNNYDVASVAGIPNANFSMYLHGKRNIPVKRLEVIFDYLGMGLLQMHSEGVKPDTDIRKSVQKAVMRMGISKGDIARATGILFSTLSSYLNGQRNLPYEETEKLLRFLNVDFVTVKDDEVEGLDYHEYDPDANGESFCMSFGSLEFPLPKKAYKSLVQRMDSIASSTKDIPLLIKAKLLGRSVTEVSTSTPKDGESQELVKCTIGYIRFWLTPDEYRTFEDACMKNSGDVEDLVRARVFANEVEFYEK